jgi:hypothetical protein
MKSKGREGSSDAHEKVSQLRAWSVPHELIAGMGRADPHAASCMIGLG